MLTLFVRAECPFCILVQEHLKSLGIGYESKDISDPMALNELLTQGGKQ